MLIRMASDRSILIYMAEHKAHMDSVLLSNSTKKQYVTARVKGLYIMAVNLPGLSFEYSRAIQVQQPTSSEILFLKPEVTTIKRCP